MSKKKGRRSWWVLIFSSMLILSVYTPLPYYITRPGSAIELEPMITVEGGQKDEKGAFMLTTVRMGKATPAWYIYAKLSPDVDVFPEEYVVGRGESDEDFTKRELTVMKSSQQVAEAVAFERAGYKVKIEQQGVIVMGTLPKMPAQNVLKIGDIITAMDRTPVKNIDELLEYLGRKKAGESIELTYLRAGKETKSKLVLQALPDEKGGNSDRVGFGIRPENNQLIEVPKKVSITSQKIGGPSAGLMFTLEIYDQLKKDIDLTRGYKVAGTGTINVDGTIGRIGGIRHKIIAANNAGAEIFFAPHDIEGHVSNYKEALETAKGIQTAMRIVPVKTVDDAITYLKQLKPKAP